MSATQSFAPEIAERDARRYTVEIFRTMSRDVDINSFEVVEVCANNPLHAQIVARNEHGAAVAINPRKVAA